jgi:hypothetical protein
MGKNYGVIVDFYTFFLSGGAPSFFFDEVDRRANFFWYGKILRAVSLVLNVQYQILQHFYGVIVNFYTFFCRVGRPRFF